MATHLCGECGATVGDSAITCPKCGTVDHRPKPPEPQEPCDVCNKLSRISEMTGYTTIWEPTKSVNHGRAHEVCINRVIAVQPFPCCDCGNLLPDAAKRLLSQMNLGEPPFLECSCCHGRNPLRTQGYCAQCKLPIFPWHRMLIVENPVPEQYMPTRFPCHDFCKPALDNVMRLRAANHPKREFWGWLRS